jgi:Spy/CpxP family protein refolding chaperone
MNGTRARATVLLVAIFLLGVIVGAAGAALAGPGFLRHRGPRATGPDAYLHRLTRELKLSPSQQESVRVVLRRHQPAMDSLWRDIGPRVETLQVQVRSDIRRQLTPEQQTRFQEMMRRFDAMRPVPPHAPR